MILRLIGVCAVTTLLMFACDKDKGGSEGNDDKTNGTTTDGGTTDGADGPADADGGTEAGGDDGTADTAKLDRAKLIADFINDTFEAYVNDYISKRVVVQTGIFDQACKTGGGHLRIIRGNGDEMTGIVKFDNCVMENTDFGVATLDGVMAFDTAATRSYAAEGMKLKGRLSAVNETLNEVDEECTFQISYGAAASKTGTVCGVKLDGDDVSQSLVDLTKLVDDAVPGNPNTFDAIEGSWTEPCFIRTTKTWEFKADGIATKTEQNFLLPAVDCSGPVDTIDTHVYQYAVRKDLGGGIHEIDLAMLSEKYQPKSAAGVSEYNDDTMFPSCAKNDYVLDEEVECPTNPGMAAIEYGKFKIDGTDFIISNLSGDPADRDEPTLTFGKDP